MDQTPTTLWKLISELQSIREKRTPLLLQIHEKAPFFRYYILSNLFNKMKIAWKTQLIQELQKAPVQPAFKKEKETQQIKTPHETVPSILWSQVPSLHVAVQGKEAVEIRVQIKRSAPSKLPFSFTGLLEINQGVKKRLGVARTDKKGLIRYLLSPTDGASYQLIVLEGKQRYLYTVPALDGKKVVYLQLFLANSSGTSQEPKKKTLSP